MTTNPRPRPALRRAPDATVHPAAPRLRAPAQDAGSPPEAVALRAVPELATAPGRADGKGRAAAGEADRPGKGKGKGQGKGQGKGKAKSKAADPTGSAGPGGKGKTVELVVPLPKSLRKRLEGKSAEYGYTPEQATAQLLRMWVDG
jgi:hypothetical protein